ncbi:A/G-specific adenine glycosylase [Cutibacterium acnes JCM 18918]|nr:A/G-specific adenine glycosylase [Cutibacterium acnes JCM 18918]
MIMDVVRNSPHGVKVQMALSAWPELDQASRCLESLLDDGLVHRRGNLISL